MKRLLAILAAASLAATIGAGSALAAKPAVTYTSSIVANADCSMTLTAGWARTAGVDTVYGMWYQDDVYIFTTTAPFVNGNWTFNAKRHFATMTVGPLTPGPSHVWTVRTQFYGANVALNETFSNALTTSCGV